MPLKEIKTKQHHYYLNDAGQRHGEFKSFGNGNGQLWSHCHYNNGKLHGEYMRYWDNGQLRIHVYHVNDVEVHNFLEDDSELIRTCLYIAHGAPFLGDSDVT